MNSFLSGAEGRKDTLNLQIKLAKLVTLPPKGSEKGVYLLSIAEQAYQLLQRSTESNNAIITRSAVLIISRISEYDDSTLLSPILQRLAETLHAGMVTERGLDFEIATHMAHALVAGTISILEIVMPCSFLTSVPSAS